MSATAPTVAILSTGEMGQATGKLLAGNDLRVVTSLAGRSSRTRALAQAAAIDDLGSDAALVDAADLLLAVVVPDQAVALAERLAPALAASARPPVYVECNAVAPATTRAIGALIEQAGAAFVDGGIVGPPPVPDSTQTRLYVSGAATEAVGALNGFGLDVRAIGAGIGEASALKMCYAALNKGVAALMVQLMVAAERLDVRGALDAELALSQPQLRARMDAAIPGAVPKAFRWAGEMEEIAQTFEASGITGLSYTGAARTFEAVAATTLGQLKVEQFRAQRFDLETILEQLAREMGGTRRERAGQVEDA